MRTEWPVGDACSIQATKFLWYKDMATTVEMWLPFLYSIDSFIRKMSINWRLLVPKEGETCAVYFEAAIGLALAEGCCVNIEAGDFMRYESWTAFLAAAVGHVKHGSVTTAGNI